MIRSLLVLVLFAQVANAEPLRIGTSEDYPPFISRGADGRLSGLDADILTEICRRGRFECSWVNMPLNQLLQAVASGQVDVAAGGIGNTPERDRVVDFTCPYAVFDTYLGVFLSPTRDIDLKSVKVAVTEATLYEKVLRKGGYQAEPFPSDAEAIASTMSGSTGAFFGSRDAAIAVPGTADRLQEVATLDMPPSGAAFLIAEDATALQKKLNDLLAEISADGKIDAFQKAWLGNGQGDIIAECQLSILSS
jgi:ABC-type amino acid transport substrate-binding protein